jgi:murein DD-endopeptidase MepM/ murein hydrolase activator NlpD
MAPTILARLALLAAVLALSAPNVAQPTPAAGYAIYTVQIGDTLASIAQHFNTTANALEQTNHFTDSTALVPGQKIEVPAEAAAATPTVRPGGETYTVKAGDTLAKIASDYGVTVDELAQANGIQNVDQIAVGQVLTIPGSANTYPDGITLTPSVVKQGNTLEFKITAQDAVTATGTFAGAKLQFFAENDTLFALAGISRCAQLTTYAARITTTDASGNTTPLNFGVRVSATNYPVQDITLTPQMASLLDPAIEQAENARVANTVAPFTPQQMWNGPFSMPLHVQNPPISALFGTRRSYNGGPVGLCGHEGQDFAVDGGTPVYAPAGGIVVLAEPLHVRGNVVFINHGLGIYSGFYHLSEIDAQVGQRVKTGDLLGKVGTTGFSTGDHLHWSLWVEGVYVDPIEWTNRTIP